MGDDIDALAGTRRRAIVAKVLRDRRPGDALAEYIQDARAILDALDEDTSERAPAEFNHQWTGQPILTTPTAEQQVRMDAGRITLGLFHEVDTTDLGEADIVKAFLEQAPKVAAYIRDGKVGG